MVDAGIWGNIWSKLMRRWYRKKLVRVELDGVSRKYWVFHVMQFFLSWSRRKLCRERKQFEQSKRSLVWLQSKGHKGVFADQF